jgi:D-serine deaminase-like pyridoxal phosphate-dependent protein
MSASSIPIKPGDPIAAIDTPALLVDLDRLEHNLAAMASFAAARGVRLRPHGKTHKCVAIAARQTALGAVGLCCQKVGEAEAFASGGIGDLLVTNEVIDPAKLRRLARLTAKARIGVCVDHPLGVKRLAEAAVEAVAAIDTYLELDVGGGRCGVETEEEALVLVDAIARQPRLGFAGIHAYHGNAQHLRAPQDRRAAIEAAVAKLGRVTAALAARGIAPGVVTGAGTGTFPFESTSGAYREIQPGSYVFMDRDYGDNRWPEDAPRFESSLFVLTAVMSRRAGRAVVDAGHKAHAVDSGMPAIAGRPELAYERPSDEHGMIVAREGEPLPDLEERLWLIPGHCDPTVNLWDRLIAVRGGRVEAVWPIEARGAVG